ncbi:hypothetical protein GJ744_007517 [Endocarpon pusillum]|uniref:Uncharacterized protein n=1 Tax=Endocarpon pusillum TaxID=364733 RepID=A0A8H7A3W0_9EURO|nr:hypothetical protein GJ744_007517 [Endocarpon pusillum]
MANSPYEIKSKLNSGTPSKRNSLHTPLARPGSRSHKPSSQPASLLLRRIIGTTTTSSSGLTSHYDSRTFAYCAGSAAVLANIDDDGEISYRFFRASPTASPIHPSVSFYNPTSPTASSGSRRRTIFAPKHGAEERSCSNSPRRTWNDEGSSKTRSARERVKAVSCVDLSPNGRFLAVGETGYSPRVNIFSISAGASTEVPLSILTEHSFGVRCVAFSPSSQWLATLGDVKDGFLFIWSINAKTGAARLHFTNKCTASVLSMAWCGNNLITVGTRYVKVWRVGEPSPGFQTKPGRVQLEDSNASPGPKTLSGRNSLLGSLADSTFTCVAPFSESEAILCTTTGVVCLLDDRTGSQELKTIKHLRFPAQSIAVDIQAQKVWFAHCDGWLDNESLETLRSIPGPIPVTGYHAGNELGVTPCHSPSAAAGSLHAFQSPQGSASRKRKKRKAIIAARCLSNKIVSIDDARNIRVERSGPGLYSADSDRSSVILLPAHNDPVQGAVPLPKQSTLGDYVTWSLEGTVNFWSLDGSIRRSEKVELEQPEPSFTEYDEYVNELKSIRVSDDTQWVVSGDRLGVLQVIDCPSWGSVKIRAHSAEVTDIALHSSDQSLLVATGSRDRTVQLLQHGDEGIELLQTFDDHVGAVTVVAFVGDLLLSASSDRTVIVRQKLSKINDDGTRLLAYISQRVITLKSSPTSMVFPEPDVLAIATMDRQVLTFSIAKGAAIDSFKAVDADGGDAVILSSLSINSVEDNSCTRRILSGFSSTDKSIRLYDFESGILLSRELGHTEGISDVAVIEHADDPLVPSRKTLISTGLDGLIMIWEASTALPRPPSSPLQELAQGQALTNHDLDSTPTKDSILRRPPLRKVLSKLDLADVDGALPPGQPSRDQHSPRQKKKIAAQTRCDIAPIHGHAVGESVADRLEPLPQVPHRFTSSTPASPLSREMALGLDRAANHHLPVQKSPSPPSAPPSLSTSPRNVNRAHKGGLRRPPSVPSDLRDHSRAQNRRKSMGSLNEFGSIGMAGEQVCRTLRAYRKKIKAAPKTEHLQLDELEVELLATLRAVVGRRGRDGSRRTKAATENELDNLASVMQSWGLSQKTELQRDTEYC